MTEFFSFRKMVSPLIIKIIYVLGVIVVTISGLAMLLEGGVAILVGLVLITVGNLIWRVICEGSILLFSIHDRIGSIERNLKTGHSKGERKQETTCPKCETVNVGGGRFCEQCGATL